MGASKSLIIKSHKKVVFFQQKSFKKRFFNRFFGRENIDNQISHGNGTFPTGANQQIIDNQISHENQNLTNLF
jgi:hypothetical protein